MDKPTYVYVTYIASTAERVWAALQDPEMTKQFWYRSRTVSDWTAGSKWELQDYDDPSAVGVVGQVVESHPPSRLVLTWTYPKAADPSQRSQVTFEIEPVADSVRLTVTHEDVDLRSGVTQGWPAILSSLKTLLETGKALPMTTRRWGA